MALTANVYLEINNTTKKGRIVDATNYTEEGIVLAQLSAKGLGNVISPTGTIIVNGSSVGSPLVNLASTTTSAWFDLPLDSTGEILNGTYSFTYSLRYAITAGTVDSVATTSTFVLEFTNAGRVLIAGDSLVTTGNTQTANNGTFTVSTAAFNAGSDNSTIVVTQTTLVNEGSATGTYSFDVTRSAFAGDSYTWNGCDMVSPTVTVTYDCESTQFGSIVFQDSTTLNGQMVVSRSLSGYYPNGLYPAPTTNPQTTTANSLTFSELAVGTWTHVLVLNMSATQDDGLVYTYQVRDTGETLVTCVGTLCGLTPCIESLKDKYNASYIKGQDSGLAPLILLVLQLYALAKEYKTCGENVKYAATVAQLESVLDESGQCSCGCCDENQDVPYWVDNSNLDATSIITQLQEEIDDLNIQIGGLESAVQNNANALAAYNSLIGLINEYNTDLIALVAELGIIQAAALGLNPNDPTNFEFTVDLLISNLDILETNFIALQGQLTTINDDIVQFNLDYPEYSSYTETLFEQLNASAEASVSVQTLIDQLQSVLPTLTPSNYDAVIEEIWDAIESLQIYFSLLAQQVGIALASIENIQITLANLIEQTSSLQLQINNIINGQAGIVTSKVLAFYAATNLVNSDASIDVTGDYLATTKFLKFIIKGENTGVGANNVSVLNNNTLYTIFTQNMAERFYEIEFILIPQLSPSPITFKVAGVVRTSDGTTSTVMTAINVVDIDSPTEIENNTNTTFNIFLDNASNTFYSVEVYGYDLNY